MNTLRERYNSKTSSQLGGPTPPSKKPKGSGLGGMGLFGKEKKKGPVKEAIFDPENPQLPPLITVCIDYLERKGKKIKQTNKQTNKQTHTQNDNHVFFCSILLGFGSS